jgi:hypothetical protein
MSASESSSINFIARALKYQQDMEPFDFYMPHITEEISPDYRSCHDCHARVIEQPTTIL